MGIKLSAEQRRIASLIDREADRRKVSPRVRKSAYLTGLVESNLTNPKVATDHDSLGWRQERQMYYRNPTNVRASIKRYFNEAQKANRGFKGTAGQLAQTVQRSAFPERYDQRSREGEALVRMFGGYSPGGVVRPKNPAVSTVPGSEVQAPPPVPSSSIPQVPQMLDGRARLAMPGPDLAPLTSSPAPPQEPTTTVATDSSLRSQTKVRAAIKNDLVAEVTRRADIIDKRQLPYLWGGGHQAGSAGELRGYKGPLDCSGAVSKVLGVDPRVSGQFESFGKPGARKDRITIYANAEHVLMYIPGRGFWGTSGSNPGGGAGWIPRSAVSKSYLGRFKARHI